MKKWLYRFGGFLGILALLFFFVAPKVLDWYANGLTRKPLPTISSRARELHGKIWVADLHSDALLWNRDLLTRHSRGHVDLPRLIQGNVAIQFFTVVSKVPWGLNMERNPADSDMITLLAIADRWPLRSWFSLRERALHMARRMRRFSDNSSGKLHLITNRTELEQFVRQRRSTPEIAGAILGLEGAQVLEGNLASVNALFEAGYRMMAPTHFFDTEVGGSAHGEVKGRLTPLGEQVIRLMERLGMIVDLAHASEATIEDVLKIARKPVVVSHTGVAATCPGPRNLSDAQIRAIANNGGLIGIAFFEQATCGQDLGAIVRAMRHVADLVGVEHVALGSDFDGLVRTPIGPEQLISLTEALLQAGFSGRDIALIMGANLHRLLLELLPKS